MSGDLIATHDDYLEMLDAFMADAIPDLPPAERAVIAEYAVPPPMYVQFAGETALRRWTQAAAIAAAVAVAHAPHDPAIARAFSLAAASSLYNDPDLVSDPHGVT